MGVNKPKYYLSVWKNEEHLIQRKPFDDFSEAIEACTAFYKPRNENVVLPFTTEAIGGKFAKAYTELNLPDDIEKKEDIKSKIGSARYHYAVKRSNAFNYNASLFFMIESKFGIEHTEKYFNDEGE